jgi:hypothetical protein
VCPTVASKTTSATSALKRWHQRALTSKVSCRNYRLHCASMSKESEHWPFGNWPGKGPVETKRENDNKERLRELAAKVAIEQDHDKFTALVQELNQLLDGEKQERHNAADA